MTSRRQFLMQVGGAVASAAWTGQGLGLGPEAVGFAVVGLGGLSQSQILPDFALCRRARLRALVSGSPAKAQSLAEQYGVPRTSIYDYAHFDRLVDRPDIHVVYIVLPNGMHAEYAERAFLAGKHVLCEKPMATTVADAQRMVALAKQSRRLLMVANRLRTEPLNLHLRALTRAQAFGRPQLLQFDAWTQIGPGPQWRFDPVLAGGGVLVDTGVYAVNTARMLLGEEPDGVQAHVPKPSGDERFKLVEEACTFSMSFPCGAVAVCGTTYNTSVVSRYRIACSDGWYGLDPGMIYKGLHAEASDPARLGLCPHAAERQVALEMDHFADCIINQRTPSSDGADGLQDMQLMRQIYAAAGLDRL